MTKWFVRYFTNGVITIVPIGLVIYVVINLFNFLDGLLGNYLRLEFLHREYIPGVGLVLTILLITFFGWLTTKWLTRRIFDVTDKLLRNIPFVKSFYSIVHETIQSIIGEKRTFTEVVLVQLPGSSIKMLGFVTSRDVSNLGADTDYIAVYFPFSFQISGYTALVPKQDAEKIDIPVEQAMKFMLSAGVTGK